MLAPPKRAARRLLLDAANEIELRGKRNGNVGSKDGPKCALGAMTWAATKGREVSSEPLIKLSNLRAIRAFDLARDTLAKTINGQLSRYTASSKVYMWSDRNVQQVVIDGLRQAADSIK